MHPHTRFSLALVASVALWWPTLLATFTGEVDLLHASLRWVAAFVVATVAVRVLSGLVEAYSAPEDDRGAERPSGKVPATAED